MYNFHKLKIASSFILGVIVYTFVMSCEKQCNPSVLLTNETAETLIVYVDKVYETEIQQFSTVAFDVLEGDVNIKLIQKNKEVFDETLYFECGINYLSFGY